MANLETLHNRANDALLNNQKDRAIEIYNEILKEKPTDEIALSQLMDLYNDTDRLKYYLTRAHLNITQNKLEHAINDCKKAINADHTSIIANLQLAKLYRVTNKNLKAIDVFSHTIELDPESLEAYKELCELYLIEGSENSALSTIQRAIGVLENKGGKKAELEFFQNLAARVYFDLGDYENALLNVKDEMLKVKILLQAEKQAQAKEILDKLNNKKMPKEELVQYYSLLAQYYFNEGEYENALDAVENYTKAGKPDAVSFQMKALIYENCDKEFDAAHNWGLCNKAQGKFEEALVEFLHAHQLNPLNKENLIEITQQYSKTGEKFAAVEFWQKIYELDEDATAKKVLGDFYFEQGDWSTAEKYGKKRPQKTSTTNNDKGQEVPIEEDEGFLNKIIGFFSKK